MSHVSALSPVLWRLGFSYRPNFEDGPSAQVQRTVCRQLAEALHGQLDPLQRWTAKMDSTPIWDEPRAPLSGSRYAHVARRPIPEDHRRARRRSDRQARRRPSGDLGRDGVFAECAQRLSRLS